MPVKKSRFGLFSEPDKPIKTDEFDWLASTPWKAFETLALKPFPGLPELGQKLDEADPHQRKAREGLPSDYNPPGLYNVVGENITPLDVITAGTGAMRKVPAKALSELDELGSFINPARSEAGAVGSDIGQAVKKDRLLLDNDLAGANPRSIGTNPRAQKTNPRTFSKGTEQLPTKPKEREIVSLPEDMLVELEQAPFLQAERRKQARIDKEFAAAAAKSKPREKVVPRAAREKTPEELQFEADEAAKAFEQQTKEARDLEHTLNSPVTNDAMLRAAMGDEAYEEAKKLWLRKSPVQQQPLSKSPNVSQQRPTSLGQSTHQGQTTQRTANQAHSNKNQPPQPPNTPPGSGGTNPPSNPNQPPKTTKKATLFQNIFGIPKSLKSMIDVPVLRQSVVPALTHPVDVGFPALKAGLKSQFGTEKMYQDIVDEIAQRPNAQAYADFGMAIPDVGIRQEYPSSWLDQGEEMLGIRGPITRSEEGYDATMKVARANLADKLIGHASQKYPSGTPDETMEGISNFVNDFTGYGSLGPLEKSADTLAVPFYSPRMIASRAQMLNPVNYLGGNRWGDVGKSAARKDMAKFVGGTAAGLGAIDLATDEDSPIDVEWDPRSSDFGSVQANNTTFDTSGGMRPMINLAARLASGQSKSTRDDENVFPVGRGETLGRFARSKLAPGVPTMLTDALFGDEKDFVGRPIEREALGVPYLPWVGNQVAPMYPADISETFAQSGPEVGSLAAGLGMLGVGSTSYDRTPKKRARKSSARR